MPRTIVRAESTASQRPLSQAADVRPRNDTRGARDLRAASRGPRAALDDTGERVGQHANDSSWPGQRTTPKSAFLKHDRRLELPKA